MQVAIVEQGVAPGGGAWLGGQLFSAMVVSLASSPLLVPCVVTSVKAHHTPVLQTSVTNQYYQPRMQTHLRVQTAVGDNSDLADVRLAGAQAGQRAPGRALGAV